MSKAKQLTTNFSKLVGIVKRTSQGGKAKTSSMNKHKRKSFKRYRGQGR